MCVIVFISEHKVGDVKQQKGFFSFSARSQEYKISHRVSLSWGDWRWPAKSTCPLAFRWASSVLPVFHWLLFYTFISVSQISHLWYWTEGLSSSHNKITERLNIIPAVIAVLYKFTSTGVCDYNPDLSSRGEDPLSGVSPAPLSTSTLSFTSSTAERFIFGWNTSCFPEQQLAHLAPHCLKPYTNLFPLPSLLPWLWFS